MSRDSRYDNSGAYRVVQENDHPNIRPTYHGPYATKGAAKGVRTAKENIARRYGSTDIFRLEVIVGPWKALNE